MKLLCLAAFCLAGCEERGPGKDNGEKPDISGYVTEAGVPVSSVVLRKIGRDGGTINDETGRLTIDIPAGALETEQTVSIQPITNTNGTGKGLAYRLAPHGTLFSRHVTITIRYTEDDIKATLPEALGLAYQNDKGVWMAVGGVKLDTIGKTVSIRTNHFSDWSFFEALTLEAATNVLDPGGRTVLAVRSVLNDHEQDLLAPLTTEGIESELLNPDHLVNPKHIESWNLMGEGRLKAGLSTAEYVAPAKIPKMNPSEFWVKIKLGGGAIGYLVTRIYVAPPGISVQVNSEEWRTLQGAMNNLGGLHMIDGKDGAGSIGIHWNGSLLGSQKWTLETVVCTYTREPHDIFYHIYGSGPSISKGGLTTEESQDITGESDVVGTFDVKSSGHLDLRDPRNPTFGTETIHGVFRVKQL